jgi:hypothetical protein
MDLRVAGYGAAVPMAYIPATCMVSLLYVMDNGDSAEIAVIGNDGMVRISVFMGDAIMSESGGRAKRRRGLPAEGGSVQRNSRWAAAWQIGLRFTQALMAQMVQTGACNRHHTVEQQLCRWLLLTLDRLPGNNVTMTKQLIANMLGVGRDGAIEATNKLQKGGSIRYDAGQIIVLDRKILESACECYAVVRNEIERLLAYEPPPELPRWH